MVLDENSVTEQVKVLPRRHRHLGSYGVCVSGAYVLLVRKSRGPYTGLLDLPGVGIEFGETPEDALRREFIEETGLSVVGATLMTVESNVVKHRAADSVDENLHHIGLIYRVVIEREENSNLMPAPKSEPDGEDSAGAMWHSLDGLADQDLTPFALYAFGFKQQSAKAVQKPVASEALTFGEIDQSATYVDRRAAYAIILRGETVATIKSASGKYFLPGGSTLPDETAQQTILREIHEELSCDAIITGWLGEAEQYFYSAADERHYRMEATFAMAELAGDTVAATDDAGAQELHWLPLAVAQEKLFHECHSWMVKMIRSEFRGEIASK